MPIGAHAGRIDIEWNPQAPVTPRGQMAFFIGFPKSAGLFDDWVACCPRYDTSPNALSRRDVLLSILPGHRRYAHITALRSDKVNPSLLGMRKVLREDAVRRAFEKIGTREGIAWLRGQRERVWTMLPWSPRQTRRSSRSVSRIAIERIARTTSTR
ncbi:MAG: hypothetical protein ACREFY_19315 [Acetobacteraceae bacterium]